MRRYLFKVKYPDQVTQMVTPRSGDVKMLTGNRYRLSSKVLLSHTQWSGKSAVAPFYNWALDLLHCSYCFLS